MSYNPWHCGLKRRSSSEAAADMNTLDNDSSRRGETAGAVKLCIGVCTRHRPSTLARLLQSLRRMDIPPAVDVTLCVVENDHEPRSRELVETGTAGARFITHYQLEPRIGIPQARNRLLDAALDRACAALIFIDDDEEVAPDWLCALERFARETEWQSVIQGREVTRMPEGASEILAPFFQRKERATGDALSLCATNNTLLPLEPVRRHGLRFDERRTTEGGEDSIFFGRVRQVGTPLVFCREAVVIETVPRERANLWWLCRRKFRVGLLMGSGSIAGKQRSLGKVLYYAVKALGHMLQSAVYILLFQRERSARALLNACRCLGYSLGYFQIKTQPYRQVEG